jgi:phage terminase large subunit-like protein
VMTSQKPTDFKLTERQAELNRMRAGPATHILVWGGSRSGKTFTMCRAICIRAMRAPGSRHLIARYRFNHVVQSNLAELQALPARERLGFGEGKFGDVGENALWSFETLETYRVNRRPDLRRIIVAVDPSGTKGNDEWLRGC